MYTAVAIVLKQSGTQFRDTFERVLVRKPKETDKIKMALIRLELKQPSWPVQSRRGKLKKARLYGQL